MVHFPQERSGLTGEPGKTPFNIDTLRSTLPAQRVVPKAERMQREALQAVVNSYFDGITSHNGYIVKGHPGCSRYENGFPTFNTPMRPGMDIGNDGKTDCRTQGDFGVAIVAMRNFYVIDEESQAVMVAAMFRRDAEEPEAAQPLHRTVPPGPRQDPRHPRRVLLPAGRSPGAELAAVRWPLSAAGQLSLKRGALRSRASPPSRARGPPAAPAAVRR